MFPGAGWILLLLALIVPAFFVLSWLISSYNRLIVLRKGYIHAYAQVGGLLKRRYDLVLNVLETAKGYLHHDLGTPDAVLAARNAASAANLRAAQSPGEMASMKELAGAEAALAGTLTRLFTLVNAYPELKTDTTMCGLKEELAENQNKLGSASQVYNDAVMRYNMVRGTFPNNMVALPLGFFVAENLTGEKPERMNLPKAAVF